LHALARSWLAVSPLPPDLDPVFHLHPRVVSATSFSSMVLPLPETTPLPYTTLFRSNGMVKLSGFNCSKPLLSTVTLTGTVASTLHGLNRIRTLNVPAIAPPPGQLLRLIATVSRA